ncbi:hypothetical protein [Pontibacter beigongshangensis]|uniref:hypothetical protein n=1 Tax=Pontibacter beigongshangensis TaxID=2574733 RepID=UPI00165022A9|nr:hypothetical protein [Pontibacter beigongshangensis]
MKKATVLERLQAIEGNREAYDAYVLEYLGITRETILDDCQVVREAHQYAVEKLISQQNNQAA